MTKRLEEFERALAAAPAEAPATAATPATTATPPSRDAAPGGNTNAAPGR
jgi:hypothetical protein